jgi:hypothetical protein
MSSCMSLMSRDLTVMHYKYCRKVMLSDCHLKWRTLVLKCNLAVSLSIVPVGIGEHKSSKMAHFVFKCNKEDYLSEVYSK